jgi:nitroreductase
MENNEVQALYAEISKRMSVRDYRPDEPDGAVLGKIEEKRKSLAALDGSTALLRVIPAEKAGVAFGHAPYCLCSYAKDDDDDRLNASFLLQEMSLYLSTLGFGSCWVGMGKPKNGFLEHEGLPFFKLLVFGKATGVYRRENTAQFKRKPLSEITGIQDCPKVLEAVRLAPSAMNRQGVEALRGRNENPALHGSQQFSCQKNAGSADHSRRGYRPLSSLDCGQCLGCFQGIV